MHNFIVLIFYSQVVNGNQENLLVQDNEKLAKEYKDNFENLWEEFSLKQVSDELTQQSLGKDSFRVLIKFLFNRFTF